ncbi:ornithine carbamoyltransferase [Oceanicella actignis]|nr:ornithine carbamoyltransferase [Oceanicella actignis]
MTSRFAPLDAALPAGMRHFLDLHAVAPEDLRAMIDAAHAAKAARAGLPRGATDQGAPLAGRILGMIFEKPSTRTRVSFDVGIRQLGGQGLMLSSAEMQLGRGESIADTARVLSRFLDIVMIRTGPHEKLLELARHAAIPVINGLTDASHPCQLMADVMTIEEQLGPIKGRTVAWVGDGNNMCASFIEAAAQFGFALRIACPEPLSPPRDVLAWAAERGADVHVTRDPREAVSGVDVVATDTWISMGDTDRSREKRHAMLRPFQVNAALVELAAPHAIFLHCLPAHPGEEASEEVMYGPRSVIFDEAENRLHAQKAVMRWCLGAL